MDRLELMEVNGAYPTPEEVAAELPNFVTKVQELINEHYAANLSNLTPPRIYIHGGRKYIKIAKQDNQTSVYCFVRAADGAILKAATSEPPAEPRLAPAYTPA